ncbi:conserved hypothetical protein [Vibrio chagasii]|nr:conserved hypothetical protein [Vibrio chagasii]CAH6888807.1 conserved hypothetical protein [Vibrio chagasii]CAH7155846.1 conserved hypothetical protein [Vibrio chagasii]CAH7187615.1 conserved hypothetical protein [Vibrio chagasii]CAH7187624.1 conserved hypothetical protein [Vibrio chagasii]
MDYETKIQLALKELSDKGVWKSNYNPPIDRLLRKLGFRIRPPYYQGFFSNFVFCLVYFAPIWWGFEWFLEWNEVGISMLEAAYKSLQCGALFGLLMSIFYAIRRKQLNLTDWDSLGE